ncbi:MAG: radical SAM protein [Deltaproteobacteria bacterium]|nr:radical SAM protein [Deltaproteobacteria bacterium]
MRCSSDEILEVAKKLKQIARSCRLCPRECGVDRTKGERGYCGAGLLPSVSSIVKHFGEEPPLVGNRGAGTIFFSYCNLRCVYCQNHQISRGLIGEECSIQRLASEMISLQAQGALNIEPVSPTHQVHAFIEALGLATGKGVDLPIVYNCGGYESLDVIKLLDGIVDIYLPDLKYADNNAAAKYSDCLDYFEFARAAILEMYSQVGNLELHSDGNAVRGLMIRHLVLPNDISGSIDTLHWIKANLSTDVTISLMAQYSPQHEARKFGELNRRINRAEYDRVVDECWELGFENVFIQDFQSQDVGIPDFSEDEPFRWG